MDKHIFNIVLVEPEIPQNTGNIARTCAAIKAALHIVRPMGFEVSDKYLKRAGLDYWQYVDIQYYECFDEVKEYAGKDASFYYCTTKGSLTYSDVNYSYGDYLVFGKETRGLPEPLLAANYDRCIRIPMEDKIRSLNLGNSVAIIAYEAMRQLSFEGLQNRGKLHGIKMD